MIIYVTLFDTWAYRRHIHAFGSTTVLKTFIMKLNKIFHTIMFSTLAISATAGTPADNFKYTDEKFADIQMLRYKVQDFEKLSLQQKTLIYYLSEAALYGRDILFD